MASTAAARSILPRLQRGRLQPFFLKSSRFFSLAPKIFVGGLSPQISEARLREAFSAFGEVTEAKIVIDIESGKSKGFAFVRFALDSNAETAIKAMNGRELNGKILRVGRAIERPRMLGGMGFDSSSSDGRDYANCRYSDGGQYGS